MAQNARGQIESEARVQVKPPTLADRLMFGAVALFFVLALLVWRICDHSYPFWDGAAHVKDSMAYANLIRHAHLFNPTWIKQFLTVNFDYPMTIHLINGAIKALIGFGRESDTTALLLYQLVLICSIYKLTFLILKDRLPAVLSVIFVCSYPLVTILSHVPLLDLGYLAFTALGLYGTAFFDQDPGWRRAIVMGITLCLGATSKQIAALFLIGPCLIMLGRALFHKQWSVAGQLCLAGLFPALGLALWMVPNKKALEVWRDYYKDDPTLKGGLSAVFSDHAGHYLNGMISMLSPWLLLLAAFAVVYLLRAQRGLLKAMYIPISSSLFGLALMSCLALNRPEQRYVVPVTITTAILSAALLSAWINANKVLKILALFTVFCTILQFVVFNFTPYPIPASDEAVKIIYKIAGHSAGQELAEPRPSPTANGDKWGQEWLVSEIEKVDRGHLTTLNIVPSTPDISVHTIDLVCIAAGKEIQPSTFRQFTLHGDIVRYDEKAIQYYQWFLLKTGYQGSPLDSQASRINYQKLISYIENPKNYRLVSERDLPDGTKLKLYRRIAL